MMGARASLFRLILRSTRRVRLEGWGGPWFETRYCVALLTMRS
ncbi:MAG: hypothetical protein OJF62_001259 [Pseudolabrys sp.]|jgi:hypothetical protein|nr:hypothetical protein [Pseudolabrys sp.]